MRFPIATTLCLDYLYYELHALMMYYLRPSCVLTAIACAEQKETKISHKLTLTFPCLTHIQHANNHQVAISIAIFKITC